MSGLTVCTFKWNPAFPGRKSYRAWHVNRMAAMFRRHLRTPHSFVCVTDDPTGLDLELVRPVALWPDLGDIPNPHGIREPACYRRLKLYSQEAAELVGERILAIDLDMVLVGDITPLVDRPEPVVLLATDAPNIPTNGSIQLISPGAAEEVWTSFDPATSPKLARRAGCYGSDQGWLSYQLLHGCLKDRAGLWRAGEGGDGIWFYGAHMRRLRNQRKLPAGARLVSFHGRGEPWGMTEQLAPWVQKHYGPANGQSVPDGWSLSA